MYGKHFESLYEGSMYGAGLPVFAVWGYVIAHTKGSRVELNPRKLADTLGGDIDEIRVVIEKLQQPDVESRCKAHEGRRLVKEGEFQYYVPSWEHYQAIRRAEDRRDYNARKQAERRAALRVKKGGPSAKGSDREQDLATGTAAESDQYDGNGKFVGAPDQDCPV